MSRDDVFVSMRRMMKDAVESVAMAQGKTRADLDQDKHLNFWLARSLESMGEAAAVVAQEEQDRFPDIPWFEVIGMRDRFVHGYNAIDFDILWQIVTQDLPVVIESLRKALLES